MQKEQLSNFNEKTLLYSGNESSIYRLEDKRLLKVYSKMMLDFFMMIGINYEQKILDTRAHFVDEIVSPLSVVYDGNICCAYTMEEIAGKTLNEYDKDLTMVQRTDLKQYFDLYKKIEDVIIKSNKVGIVMPDLCTCDNIIIKQDGRLKFIDYDGMQFGDEDKSIAISTSLGNTNKYMFSSKYNRGFGRFTNEIDKTSLTILMFLIVFNIDLNKVGMINPCTSKTITLKEIFRLLGIYDEIFMNKVAANLSSNKPGVYLQDELYKIMKNYNMVAFSLPGNKEGTYIKKLSLK